MLSQYVNLAFPAMTQHVVPWERCQHIFTVCSNSSTSDHDMDVMREELGLALVFMNVVDIGNLEYHVSSDKTHSANYLSSVTAAAPVTVDQMCKQNKTTMNT